MPFHTPVCLMGSFRHKESSNSVRTQDISIPSASNYSCLQAYQSEHKYTVLSAYYTSCLRVFCLCLGCYIPGIKQLCSWLITQKVLCREICRKGVFEAEEESGFNAEFVFF